MHKIQQYIKNAHTKNQTGLNVHSGATFQIMNLDPEKTNIYVLRNGLFFKRM